MTVLVSDLVVDIMEHVGEVAGAGVQTYSEDGIRNAVGRAFNIVFKKYFWDNHSKWYRVELDGTLGIPDSNDLQYVRDFEDFGCVCLDGKQNRLPVLGHINPNGLTGTRPRFWTSLHVNDANYALRKLQFYPVTSTGYVNVFAREYPKPEGEPWGDGDTMYLDRDMLAWAGAFMVLAGDDTNPGNAEVARNLMEMRFRDILKGLARHETRIDGDTGIPTEWVESR